MDSIEESAQCNDTSVLLASVDCVGALLETLEALCKGEGINHESADITNSRYITLKQADYSGPLTYESMARLPTPYSGIEGNMPENEGGTESDCSGATEGPEDIITSDDSIIDDESFLTNQELQKLYKWPRSFNLTSKIDKKQKCLKILNTKQLVHAFTKVFGSNKLNPKLLEVIVRTKICFVASQYYKIISWWVAALSNPVPLVPEADRRPEMETENLTYLELKPIAEVITENDGGHENYETEVGGEIRPNNLKISAEQLHLPSKAFTEIKKKKKGKAELTPWKKKEEPWLGLYNP
ncbi:unnamed protein product [Diabrotica balteata]|uniref:Uncharacterized protein n=1 Tax=Diabrotica balteata TaxID=107213 RepID=A0A9N9SZD9_DIABA|nr:unnamed protein product [Diabrotica balteata]